jgi:hypothetical protein
VLLLLLLHPAASPSTSTPITLDSGPFGIILLDLRMGLPLFLCLVLASESTADYSPR